MPGLSGIALAEKLAAARPETKVLYTSGDVGGPGVRPGLRGRACAVLEKPYMREELIRKVRELLDSPKLLSL
jgi:two-component system cell cycle sensor histidine kinase/response regulator CckA